MGCFDVTCRLTNTAISAYEECIMIIIDADSNTSFYELMRLVHRQSKRESQEYSKHEIQLIEENPALWKGYFLPVKGVYLGRYNDYGSVDQDLTEKNEYDALLFFHKWAVEFIMKDKAENLLKNKIEFAAKLFSKMFYLRKSPMDLSISGQQHKDIDEMEFIIALNKQTNAYLLEKISEYRKNNEE